jgi:hypothetical protein
MEGSGDDRDEPLHFRILSRDSVDDGDKQSKALTNELVTLIASTFFQDVLQ